MRTVYKTLMIILATSLALLVGAALTQIPFGVVRAQSENLPEVAAPLDKAPIVINLSSGPNNPHAALMALELAAQAVRDEREVTLFFSIHGVLFLKKNAAKELGFSEKRLEEIRAILNAGQVTAIASPQCLKAMGMTAAELPPKVSLATPDLLFGPLDRHGAVFSF